MRNKRITEILGIQGFFVADVEIQDKQIIIDIEREREVYICSNCGQESFLYHDYRQQLIRDLDMSGKLVSLRFNRYRIKCNCGKGRENKVVERLFFVDVNRRMTKRFEGYIYGLSLKMTIKGVSRESGINWHSVKQIEKLYIKKLRHRVRWKHIKRLAIDEVSWNGRTEYLTIVTDRDGQGVVWIGEGRSQDTLDRFFVYVGKDRYSRFKIFTIDMNRGYIASIKKYCKGAKIVYDLFHIIRILNKKLNELRSAEMTKGRKAGKEYCRNNKWLIMKGKENLGKEQEVNLRRLLRENENLHKGYLLKEMFREIFKERTQTVELLTERLKCWIEDAWATGLKPLQSFCKTIIEHFDGITSYFRYRITNGIAEGINNIIKRISRMAYGYRDKEYFKLKIIQQCSPIVDYPSL